MPKHALLSASSSDRWIHCPPSARLSETYEDKGSDYAAEGTDAHSLCEYKLKKALGMEADDPTEHLSWFNQEMDDHATGYAAYVLEQVEAAKETCSDPVVLIEQRVDFSRWVEEGFGTADCIVIADGTLQIIDFKYGLGVLVSAEENPHEWNLPGDTASPAWHSRLKPVLFAYSARTRIPNWFPQNKHCPQL